MVLPIAAMLMGYGLKKKYDQGVQADEDRARKVKIEDEDRAYMLAQRDRTAKLQAEDDAFRASMKDASKPLTVEDGTTYQPAVDDEGNAMPANPTAGTFKVGGKRIADRGAADAMAEAGNTPLATMRRQADVLMQHGRATDAMELKKQSDAWEADEGLKDAGRLLMTGGWGAVPEVYARYKDGKSAKVEPDANGGATVISIDDATGKEVGRTQFKDLPQLFSRIAGRFDPKLWAADEIRRANDAEVTRRWTAEQGVREKNADSQATLRAAQAEAAQARAEAATMRAMASGRGGTGGAAQPTADAPPMTAADTFDRKTAVDIAKEDVKRLADAAALSQAPMSPAAQQALVEQHVAAAYSRHANAFVQQQVGRALSAAQADPAAYASAYGKALKVMPQSALAQLGFKPPAGAGAPKADPTIRNAPPGSWTRPGNAPAASMVNTSTPAAPPSVSKDAALGQIETTNKSALDTIAAELVMAKQQLAAVAKSGDPQALAAYSKAVQQASDRLKTEAAKRLGNRAPQYLQSVL